MIRSCPLAIMGFVVAAAPAMATVVQLDVRPLINADVVVNNGSGSLDPTQSPIDHGSIASGNFCFMTQSVAVAQAGGFTPDGLPDDASFPADANHPDVQLWWSNGDDGPNARRTADVADTFTVDVPPDSYSEVHLYATCGDGTSPITMTLLYDDFTTTAVNATVPDWFNDPVPTADQYPLIDGRDRMQPGSGPGTPYLYEDSNDPAIFGFRLLPDPAKTLTGVRVDRTAATSVFDFFGAVAVSVAPPRSCCVPNGAGGVDCFDLVPADCAARGGRADGPGSTCATTDCTITACCRADGSCVDLPSADCTLAGGTPGAPLASCAATACPQPEACCLPGGACLDLLPVACAAQGGASRGPGSTCATTTCTTPEACCFASGACTDLLPVDCSAQGGLARGPGTTCATTACPQPEACCLPGGACQDLLPVTCAAQGGMSRGPGSTCATTTCTTPEACCFSDGTCANLLPVDCSAQGGLSRGPGTTCATTPCPAPEACCFSDGTCANLLPVDCGAQGGLSRGPGTTCATTPCPAPEACCFSDGTCADLLPVDCGAQGGLSRGPGTTCATTPCPAPEACCFSDGTCADLLPVDCGAQGGMSVGVGSRCATTSCLAPAACCFAGGACADLLPADCATQGGATQGAGTRCATTTCPAFEACCLADGTCRDLDPAACAGLFGVSQGPGTTCAATACPQPEACCLPGSACLDLLASACGARGGVAQGAASSCASSPCAPAGPPGFVPNGAAARPGVALRVAKSGAAGLVLTWDASCSASATDHAVQAGHVLRPWAYDHAGVAGCTTSGALTLTIAAPAAGDTYYVVVPLTASEEGSYGLAEGPGGASSERPRSTVPCRPAQDVSCN